jgi:hypothetical protein
MAESKNLMQRLLLVQKEIKAITKDETNPFFKSSYFNINGLLRELKPVLDKHGVVVLQPLTNIEGKPAIATLLVNPDDAAETLSFVTPLIENPDSQKMGASITYFRRYALQSIFLLEAEDDDGNSVSGKNTPAVEKKPGHIDELGF